MKMPLKGIHHISAMTANAKENYDFYTKILGLRLIKKTVNQDNPTVYHLFYGDKHGSPGTELTFFEIPNLAKHKEGVCSISATSMRVPSNKALKYWENRFEELDIVHGKIKKKAGRLTMEFQGYESQRLILVSDENNKEPNNSVYWDKSVIPKEFAITGLGPVQLTVRRKESTLRVLVELFGYRVIGSYPSSITGQPDIIVLEAGEGGSETEVHLEVRNDLKVQRLGRGGVHHVAFRVENEDALYDWMEKMNDARYQHSGLIDRYYFQSVYFRESNGILFELATDGPGFATDEDIEHLGESLALPPFLESKRAQIEEKLVPLDTTYN